MMQRFTPTVQVGCNLSDDHDPACPVSQSAIGNRQSAISALSTQDSGLFLDVTGTQRLFGSIENLLARVTRALAGMRVSARVAVAPTPGAAYALTFAGRPSPDSPPATVVEARDLPAALAPLPPAALRLDDPTLAGLHHLGLMTVGQVLKVPRDLVPARFGPGLLHRLDQALGRTAEPLVPLAHFFPIEAAVDFDGTVDALEALWLSFKGLIARVTEQLVRRGAGARRMGITFLRPGGDRIEKTIDLATPSRDPAVLFNLVRCAMEALDPQARGEGSGFGVQGSGFGTGRRSGGATKRRRGGRRFAPRLPITPPPHLPIATPPPSCLRASVPPCLIPEPTYDPTGFVPSGFTGLRLAVPLFERVEEEQIDLLGRHEHADRRELARLVECLRIRLGDGAVVGVEAVESHIPERAWGEAQPKIPEDGKLALSLSRGWKMEGRNVQRPTSNFQRPTPPATFDCPFPTSLTPHPPISPSPYRATDSSSILHPPSSYAATAPRPLHLLPTPQEIRVMVRPSYDRDGAPVAFAWNGRHRRIVHAVGPERIAGAWWTGHDKTRDYFDAEDDTGRRWWLFRVTESARWFLHGEFE